MDHESLPPKVLISACVTARCAARVLSGRDYPTKWSSCETPCGRRNYSSCRTESMLLPSTHIGYKLQALRRQPRLRMRPPRLKSGVTFGDSSFTPRWAAL